jgi:hypothetical protein
MDGREILGDDEGDGALAESNFWGYKLFEDAEAGAVEEHEGAKVPSRPPHKCNLIPIEEEEAQEDAEMVALRQRCTQQVLDASETINLQAGTPSLHI